jgi:hypothetical protein
VIIGLFAILLLVAAVSALTHFSSKPVGFVTSYGSDSSFLEQFSLNAWRPMLRLASQMDRKFVATAHGEPLAACYRKIQRGLLREYLRAASADFNRLYSIANANCVKAAEDPDNLSMTLFEQQITFSLLIWGIEARLLLDGMLPFTISVAPLMDSFENLAIQTRALARPQLSYQAF